MREPELLNPGDALDPALQDERAERLFRIAAASVPGRPAAPRQANLHLRSAAPDPLLERSLRSAEQVLSLECRTRLLELEHASLQSRTGDVTGHRARLGRHLEEFRDHLAWLRKQTP